MRSTVIIILAAIMLILFGILIFGHGPSKPTTTVKELPTYSDTNAQVQTITDGPVNGDDVHRQVRITIDRNTRSIDIIQGYQGHVIQSKTYQNNENAYNIFLQALSGAGFTKSRKSDIKYEYSICPTGNHFFFNLIGTGDDSTDTSYWTTSCGGGTSAASASLVQTLFRAQITDYDTIASNASL